METSIANLVITVHAEHCPKCSPNTYGNAMAPEKPQCRLCKWCGYSWFTNNPEGGVYITKPNNPALNSVGVTLIAKERHEQIHKHGFDVTYPINNEYYRYGELKDAALYLLTTEKRHYPDKWGDELLDSVTAKSKRMSYHEFKIEMLKMAGALLAAEIDRLTAQKTQP